MCCTHGRMLLEQLAGAVVVAAVRRVQDVDVLAGQHVRRAGEPRPHAPEEVVGGLVVGAAHDRDPAGVAVAQGQEAGEVAARLLDADDQRVVGHQVEALEADLDAGPSRVVVEDRRQPGRPRRRRRSGPPARAARGSDVGGAASISAS